MRKWIAAIGCSIVLLSGCSQQAAPNGADNRGMENQGQSENNQQIETLNQNDSLDADTVGILSAPAGPELSTNVTIRQLDGTVAAVPGSLVINESIGYYLYLLPGFQHEVNAESGTLTLTAVSDHSQAVIEALPPQADVQLAADELKTSLEQLDENMLQVTDYNRYEFWSDAYIYRAYNDEDRITAIIKSVHDIPLRITITEPTDIDALHLYMAMIATTHTDAVEEASEVGDGMVRRLINQAIQLQDTVISEFGQQDEAESGEAGNRPTAEQPDESPDGANPPVNMLPLSDFVQSMEEAVAYFETVYTPNAAATAIERIGLITEGDLLQVRTKDSGAPLHWDRANISLISNSDEEMRYLLRVPAGDEGVYKLREIALRKLNAGWRIHTPLEMYVDLSSEDDNSEE